MDKREVEKIKEIISNIFNFTSCSISKLDFTNEDNSSWFLIDTPDSSFMIGRDGETLKAINHIVQKITEKDLKEGEQKKRFFIDINGYQRKRFENLKNIAHMMAERARYFKSNIEIEPMPSYERRIIHLFLENEKDIVTESEGFGKDRRVIVKYTGNIGN